VLTFTIRRLLTVPLLLLGVAVMTFVLLRNAPGDYFTQMELDPARSLESVMQQKVKAGLVRSVPFESIAELGPFTDDGETWEFREGRILRGGEPQEARVAAKALGRFRIDGREYQCDEQSRIYVRIGTVEGFFRWIGRVAKADFGISFQHQKPVLDLLGDRLWNTLTLSLASLLLAWGIAIPLGVIAAVKPGSIWDHTSGFIAFFGLSIPSVFFALLMILLASYTGWFPIGDMRDAVHYDEYSALGKLWNRLHHLVLPTIVIGTGAMAGYMRQARGNMIEALGQDYVRTARAKGLSRNKVLFQHALRNAINPLITLFGYSLAALLSGSFLVEVVMNWPGMARLVVDAIISRDEPVVMASVMVSALLLVAGNLVADLLLAAVDPRVRLS